MIKTKVAIFGGPAFFQPIRAFRKLFKFLWLAKKCRPSKKAAFV